MRALVYLALLVAAVAGAACSHAPARAGPRDPPPEWPRPPAPAQVTWERALPDPDRADPRSGFRRFFDTFLGIEPGANEPVLVRPFGLAAPPGQLLIADPDGPALVRVDLATAAFTPLACADGGWGAPMAALAGPLGAVLVADAGLGQVVRLGTDGRCERWGRGLLERPSALALVGDRLYVADPPRHTIEIFGADGQRVGGFGSRGDGDEGFNFPTGLAAAPDGTLLVVDSLNFKVKRFSADGAQLASFGEPGEGPGQFVRPKCVTTDPAGRIYVSDTQRGQVLVFDSAGAFLYAVGEVGEGPGQLSLPAGVAVEGGTLFIADGQHRRIESYRFTGERP
jgi:sugar lactone lactonase YvrE